MMRFNLGCGFNRQDGYVNVDKVAACGPDVLMDLERTPWAIDSDVADEVLLNHCLEHVGHSVDTFLSVMQELYRICKAGATIQINVPHPRHNNFLNDPTHVRVITPELLGLFSKRNCEYWKSIGAANSPLALYLDVDFEMRKCFVVLEQKYLDILKSEQINEAQLMDALTTQNNIAREYRITLEVIKPPSTTL